MRDAAHVNSRNEICIDDGDGELKTREEEGKNPETIQISLPMGSR